MTDNNKLDTWMTEKIDGQKKLKQILNSYHGNQKSNGRRGYCFDTSVLSNHRKYLKHKIRSLESVNQSSTLYYELPVNGGFSLFTLGEKNKAVESKKKSKPKPKSKQQTNHNSHQSPTSLQYSLIPPKSSEYLQSNYNRSVHKKSIGPNDNSNQKYPEVFSNNFQQQSNWPSFDSYYQGSANNNPNKFERININNHDYPYF